MNLDIANTSASTSFLGPEDGSRPEGESYKRGTLLEGESVVPDVGGPEVGKYQGTGFKTGFLALTFSLKRP